MESVNQPAMLDNKKDITLKPVRERTSAIIAYRVILNTMLREIRKEFNASVMPAYSFERKYNADRGNWFISLQHVVEESAQNAAQKMTGLLEKESVSFTKRFIAVIKRATGISFKGLFSKRDTQTTIQNYTEQNVALIKSLGQETFGKLEQMIYRAKVNKTPASQLSAEIQRIFKTSKTRANLIAVDQLASLNSDLTAARAKIAGIEYYKWHGRLDSRERALHLRLEGRTYKFGKRTDAENGLAPGKPVRCRCVASMIVPKKSILQQIVEVTALAAGAALIAGQGEADEL